MKKNIIYLISIIGLLFCLSSCSLDKKNMNSQVSTTNELLINFIDNEWEYDASQDFLGNSNTFFEDYEIYFDEGISVKYSEISEIDDTGGKGYYFSRNGNVENILFNNKYVDELFSGVKVGLKKSTIKKHMGIPQFIDDELSIWGYSKSNLYIFFIGDKHINEISIYPKYPHIKDDVVYDAINLCKNNSYSEKLALELTNLFEKEWSNYNYSYSISDNRKYSGRDGNVGIGYYSKGIQIYFSNTNNDMPILNIYGDYNYLSELEYSITDLNGKKVINYNHEKDLVFEQEKKRVEEKIKFNETVKTTSEISPDKTRILIDNKNSNGIDVIYKDNSKPSYCIITSPLQYNSAKWLNDRYIIYKYGKIYACVYDLYNNKYQKMDIGQSDIQHVQNGRIILTTSLEEDFFSYQFDNNGDISLFDNHGKPVEDISEWENGEIANRYSNSVFRK